MTRTACLRIAWLLLLCPTPSLAQNTTNTPNPGAEPAQGTTAAHWNVSDPPADGTFGGWSWRDVPLDVAEGTWMSLDLSPDGRTIVFDMLGDIYTMPVEGSADGTLVKCIAEGLAWDMQPRFSPDGNWITFVSDRTGDNGKAGDNVWVMNADGSQARQITKESFRLLTQPIWTPDGRSIIARKHFTSRRSLGAGEMWLYDASGKTDGLQITAKVTEQKDTGEPALSPDGRYLYYSLDASGGTTFEYDKDSNAGIYAIDRLDLQSQQTERLIAGPGGACRPTPSPDGKSIAFVRRVRFQSQLFVMDLASGRARPVYENLERDLQETWAVHGVYPAMAWTPDSTSIIFWARGKFRRVDVNTLESREIPFRISSSRRIAEAIRFPVEVAPDSFPVRMLRDVAISPRGDRTLFQALGHVYLRDLPSGPASPSSTPSRLTRATDEFEYFPAWSHDGSQVAFVAWNDDRLATVRVIDVATRRVADVTTTPGHYTDPVFSPDGKSVAFLRTGGGYLTSPLWSRDAGVYIAQNPLSSSFTGERPRRVALRGSSPHFAASSDMLFLTIRDGGSDSDKVSLQSIPLAVRTPEDTPRTLYKSEWATEFRVSPDGRWLAFSERFNVFVTPFMNTGKPIDVGPSAKNVPLVKVTTQAGYNIHWSGDSASLHWSMGPTLYSKTVPLAFGASGFTASAGAADDPAQSTDLSFTHPHDVPTRSDGTKSIIALVNGRILTMQNPPGAYDPVTRATHIIDDGAIVIEGNRIIAVGPRASVTIPGNAIVHDLRGSTVTPGFIDVHAHGGQGENGFTPQRNWISHANLAFGVTTIHDPSNDTQMIFAAAELAKAGEILAPRTFSTGTILYGATGSFKAEIDSLDDALFHLARMKAVGAISVKSYNQPRRDQRQMVLEAARRLNMMVVPEGGALYHHNMTMVVDGHTSVEHTLPVSTLYADALTLWGASKTGYTPTLGVAYGGLGGENYWYAKTNVWENDHLMTFVPRYVVDPRSRRPMNAPDGEWNHISQSQIAANVLKSKNAGVIAQDPAQGGPTIGAHGQLAGLAAHWEIWMFVQGGMSPIEALRAATIDGAWYVGLDRDLGSIAPGKLADLAIFGQDPSVEISNTESITHVMLNGRLYDARDLSQVAPTPTPAPTLFFTQLQQGAGTPMALEVIMRKAAESGGLCAGCGRQHP